MFRKSLVTIGLWVGLAPVALAHEFWIDPLRFQIAPDMAVAADLRNGELFQGGQQSFLPMRNTRLDAVMGNTVAPIEGRLGDRPAIQLLPLEEDGLLILLHEAAPSTITYSEWAKFLKFVDHKDFSDAASIHEARGWEKEDFSEVYTRHSKALIGVGDAEGADRIFGLETEFVALDNPYVDDFDGTMDVTLNYADSPRANAQVEVYERDAEGDVSLTVLRTDDDGNLSVPVKPGYSYLLDAVVLREAADATTVAEGPVWETLWATLTFAVP